MGPTTASVNKRNKTHRMPLILFYFAWISSTAICCPPPPLMAILLPRYIVAAISASLLLGVAVETQSTGEAAVGEGAQSFSRTLQELKQDCRFKTTPSCIKVDFLRVLNLLSRSPPFEIFPGVKVSSRGFYGAPIDKQSLLEGNGSVDETLRVALSQSLTDYLRSLTLQVSIYNQDALDYVYQQPFFTGRGKKTKFLSIYTVFAVAFALLSALVGKAMTLSVVSMVISMMTRQAIGNAPPNSPVAYDIVRRPQVNYKSEAFWATTGHQQDADSDPEPVPYPYPLMSRASSSSSSASSSAK